MHRTKQFILCLDDFSDAGEAVSQFSLKGARLLDAETLRPVAETGCGAFDTFADAAYQCVDNALHDQRDPLEWA